MPMCRGAAIAPRQQRLRRRPSASSRELARAFAAIRPSSDATPLQIVRTRRRPTSVLRGAAGVPGVVRDAFEERAFPDDDTTSRRARSAISATPTSARSCSRGGWPRRRCCGPRPKIRCLVSSHGSTSRSCPRLPICCALGRDAVGHRAHRPRVHPEPLRAGALRGGAEGRGRHPAAAAIEEAEADVLFEEWLATVGEGVARLRHAEGRGRRGRRQRAGRDPAHAARRLGMVAVPGRLGRRRLLAVGDRGEGGARGDRHRVRAGVAHRGARRPAPRLRPRPAVLAAVPLPDDRRRAARATRSRPAPVGFFRATRCRSRSPARTAGSTSRSRRSTASSARAASTRPAPRPGAASRPGLTREVSPRAARAAARRSTPRRRPAPTRRRWRRGRRAR